MWNSLSTWNSLSPWNSLPGYLTEPSPTTTATIFAWESVLAEPEGDEPEDAWVETYSEAG